MGLAGESDRVGASIACSSRANRGTKAAEKAPSANRRRKKFGSLNARRRLGHHARTSTADSTMSRTKPHDPAEAA